MNRRQKILKIIYEYNEGWKSEDSLEKDLEKLFSVNKKINKEI
jgi:hypothetical protein